MYISQSYTADSLCCTAELIQHCNAIILQLQKKEKKKRNTVGDEITQEGNVKDLI